MDEIKVLDKGFIKYIDHMGDDMRVANAARISFAKQKDSFDSKDERLLKYLADNEHTSPFRHCYITFHIKAPIFVFRQWMKHRIASEFNEISGRYVEFKENDFYIPEVFRAQAKINKQGSDGVIEDKDNELYMLYKTSCNRDIAAYHFLLDKGVAKEQARAILPLSIYSEVYWTASLQSIAHFVKLRTGEHAQWEIRQYAVEIFKMTENLFPASMKYLVPAIAF